MAQPPLSAAIGKLERKLGVTLLERTSRRVTLTPAGAVLLEQGRIAVEAADAAILRAPFDPRGLDAELLLIEPHAAVLPAGHPLAGRAEIRRADLAGEPMPHWSGQADPAAAAHWTGADTPGPVALDQDRDAGPEINDISQLLDAVTIGHAVAYVPVSAVPQFLTAGLAVVPVTDLSPSQVMVAWPDTSRSPAVAAFVRAATEATRTKVQAGAPDQAAHAPGAL
jgi:DNA-binding transcriptional LysR family regulator